MNSDSEDNLCHKFEWKEFGNLLEQFVSDKLKEGKLDNVDMIISFKRGGSILGQALACIIQDSLSQKIQSISIRDVPSGILNKTTIPTFLNRLAASPREFSDIPRLREELESEVEKRAKKEGKNPVHILVVDDNITTCLRQRLFSELIAEWFGDNVKVEKLAFCVRKDRRRAVDHKIFDDPNFSPKVVNMPWHKQREIDPRDILKREFCIHQIEFKFERDFDINALIKEFEDYGKRIYKNLGLENVIKPHNGIYKTINEENCFCINSGCLGYQIHQTRNGFRVAMTGAFNAIPRLCKESEFIISEPEYRLCGSSPINKKYCYECIHLYCSRDIFFLALRFLREFGVKNLKLENTLIDFRPHKPHDKRIEAYIHQYLDQLFSEGEMPMNVWGGRL